MLLKNDNVIINILTMMLGTKDLLTGELDFTYYERCMQEWLGKDKNYPFL